MELCDVQLPRLLLLSKAIILWKRLFSDASDELRRRGIRRFEFISNAPLITSHDEPAEVYFPTN
jgi:hypothetical protein